MYTEKQLYDALREVLSSEAVDALLKAGISLPRIHTLAAETILLDKEYRGAHVEIIREAFKDLKVYHGGYKFRK